MECYSFRPVQALARAAHGKTQAMQVKREFPRINRRSLLKSFFDDATVQRQLARTRTRPRSARSSFQSQRSDTLDASGQSYFCPSCLITLVLLDIYSIVRALCFREETWWRGGLIKTISTDQWAVKQIHCTNLSAPYDFPFSASSDNDATLFPQATLRLTKLGA